MSEALEWIMMRREERRAVRIVLYAHSLCYAV